MEARLGPDGPDKFEHILDIPQDARPVVPQMIPNAGRRIPQPTLHVFNIIYVQLITKAGFVLSLDIRQT
jgi:hypothetical protein